MKTPGSLGSPISHAVYARARAGEGGVWGGRGWGEGGEGVNAEASCEARALIGRGRERARTEHWALFILLFPKDAARASAPGTTHESTESFNSRSSSTSTTVRTEFCYNCFMKLIVCFLLCVIKLSERGHSFTGECLMDSGQVVLESECCGQTCVWERERVLGLEHVSIMQ